MKNIKFGSKNKKQIFPAFRRWGAGGSVWLRGCLSGQPGAFKIE